MTKGHSTEKRCERVVVVVGGVGGGVVGVVVFPSGKARLGSVSPLKTRFHCFQGTRWGVTCFFVPSIQKISKFSHHLMVMV